MVGFAIASPCRDCAARHHLCRQSLPFPPILLLLSGHRGILWRRQSLRMPGRLVGSRSHTDSAAPCQTPWPTTVLSVTPPSFYAPQLTHSVKYEIIASRKSNYKKGSRKGELGRVSLWCHAKAIGGHVEFACPQGDEGVGRGSDAERRERSRIRSRRSKSLHTSTGDSS